MARTLQEWECIPSVTGRETRGRSEGIESVPGQDHCKAAAVRQSIHESSEDPARSQLSAAQADLLPVQTELVYSCVVDSKCISRPGASRGFYCALAVAEALLKKPVFFMFP